MNESDFPEDTTFGVIGICGANCNLVARILKDRGFDVIGTDMSSGDDCRFKKSLEGYDIEVFYESHPEGAEVVLHSSPVLPDPADLS